MTGFPLSLYIHRNHQALGKYYIWGTHIEKRYKKPITWVFWIMPGEFMQDTEFNCEYCDWDRTMITLASFSFYNMWSQWINGSEFQSVAFSNTGEKQPQKLGICPLRPLLKESNMYLFHLWELSKMLVMHTNHSRLSVFKV